MLALVGGIAVTGALAQNPCDDLDTPTAQYEKFTGIYQKKTEAEVAGHAPTVAPQLSGNAANGVPVGSCDPAPGSTVNASVVESPRSGSTAVVDGATDPASITPAECGPASSISHIW